MTGPITGTIKGTQILIRSRSLSPSSAALERAPQPFPCHRRTIRQMRPRNLLLRLRPLTLRFAALLMLVVQGGVAISPLLDHDGRIATPHAEQRGHRHPTAHNERTCVVCAVRALQAPAVIDEPAPLPVQRRTPVEIADRQLSASRDPPPSNASRAPPSLS